MLSVEDGGTCTSGIGWMPMGGFSMMVALTGVSVPFMTPLPVPKIEGSRKYSAIPFFWSLVLRPVSHSTRKRAIIAVMKSASATFQDPP
ncbi:hypothetical protein D3C86_1951310 [compost metagenome]